MDNKELIKIVEERIGYSFSNKELLLEAITHSSFTNEMKINKRNHYERLEFLGDACLELISSEYLYDKYPLVPEGGLSKKRASMVCEPSLAICARNMNLGDYIFFGKGEDNAGGRERDSILADVTEAILGAIYLDSGLEHAKDYVYRNILNCLNEDELFVDSKTELQELIQHLGGCHEISYKVVSESGPEHCKSFTVEVKLGDTVLATGIGKTKKGAHQDAATKAIKYLKSNNKN